METIDDIVREMRDWDSYSHLDEWAHREISDFADRIEAAAKAERDESRNWCKKCWVVDMKAENAILREALIAIKDGIMHDGYGDPWIIAAGALNKCGEK